MRRAPLASECNLTNSNNGNWTDAHAVYACIHEPDAEPYCTRYLSDPSGTKWSTSVIERNQIYFDADIWSVASVSGQDFILSNQLVEKGRYKKSFSAFRPTSWDVDPASGAASQWRIGPMGACYKVWSQVAADTVSTTFGAGWCPNNSAGVIGEVDVVIPGSPSNPYFTLYFPIIKSSGTFAPNTRFDITWIKTGQPNYDFGYFNADEFPDSRLAASINPVNPNPVSAIYTDLFGGDAYTASTIPAQSIFSAMVFPVVCYSTAQQTVTIRLSRNIGGGFVSLGRPVVFRQACSWLSNQ
jgi:hypothetical protein